MAKAQEGEEGCEEAREEGGEEEALAAFREARRLRLGTGAPPPSDYCQAKPLGVSRPEVQRCWPPVLFLELCGPTSAGAERELRRTRRHASSNCRMRSAVSHPSAMAHLPASLRLRELVLQNRCVRTPAKPDPAVIAAFARAFASRAAGVARARI